MNLKQIMKIYRNRGYNKNTLYMYYNDEFPEQIFRAKHPSMDDDEIKYVKKNYLNETKSILQKPISDCQRILYKDNYTVKYQFDEQLEYLNSNSIDEWMRNIFIPNTIVDPQSVVTLFIKSDEVKTDLDGNIMLNERLPIIQYLVKSTSIIHKSKNEFIFAISGENQYNFVKIVREGDVAIYAQYNFDRLDDKEEQIPTIILQLPKATKYWQQVPGIKKLNDDDELENFSYFDSAIPRLKSITYNLILRQCIEARHSFPQRWYIEQNCKTCNGGERAGTFGYDEKNSCDIPCPSCKGTGQEIAFNVFKDIVVKIPKSQLDSQLVPPTPPAGYVGASLEYSRELTTRIKEDTDSAFAFMGIHYSQSDVKGSETALGQMIDREMFYGFLETIAPDILKSYDFVVNLVSQIRFPDKHSDVAVKGHSNYSIVSEAQLNAEFVELLNNGAPQYQVREKLKEIYTKSGKQSDFEIVDKYYLYRSEKDINTDVGMQLLSKETAIISKNVMRWVALGISENSFNELAKKEMTTMDIYSVVPNG